MSATIIVQCSEKKHPGPRAAGTKYDSRNHRTVEQFMVDGGWAAGWSMYVLSAEHGLVRFTDVIGDYDNKLTAKDGFAHLVVNSAEVAAEIEGPVLFLGSKLYHQACEAIMGRRVQHIGRGGKGCGDYFAALQRGFSLYDEDA